MNRGMIFSTDAVFAVIVAVSLMVALGAMQQSEKGKEKAFETVAQQARDKAAIGFYTAPANEQSDLPTGAYYYCVNMQRYNTPMADGAQNGISIIKKCEGKFQ